MQKKRDGRERNFREMVAKDKKYKTEKKIIDGKEVIVFIKKTVIIISKKKRKEGKEINKKSVVWK